jgi:hypothetical protein
MTTHDPEHGGLVPAITESMPESWTIAYQRWDGRCFIFDFKHQIHTIDRDTMKRGIHALTTGSWRSRIAGLFMGVEVGTGMILKVGTVHQ